jgi:hypothetical protein
MNQFIRTECKTDGCTRLTRKKGKIRGIVYYGNKCNACHRNMKFADREFGFALNGIPNPKCERCGWAEAPCDRHKINPSLGYIKENVIILCPNCHRLETLGLIEVGNTHVDLEENK